MCELRCAYTLNCGVEGLRSTIKGLIVKHITAINVALARPPGMQTMTKTQQIHTSEPQAGASQRLRTAGIFVIGIPDEGARLHIV